MADVSNQWRVSSVDIVGKDDGNKRIELIIEATPDYGNCKKWKGEHRFALCAEHVEKLKQGLDREIQKAHLIEVAVSELKAIKSEFEEEYQDKLAKVLKETGLTVEDLDHWERHL